MRFLSMSEAGHDASGLSDGDFLNCVFFQVEQLVGDGWYSFLLMIKYTVQIFTNFAFIVISIGGKVPIWPILCVLLIMLPAVAATTHYREVRQNELINTRQDAEDSWVHCVNEIVATRHTIVAFEAVERAAGKFKKLYEDFYTKHRRARFYQQTSEWVPSWVMALVLCGLYATAPALIVSFGITAGNFASVVKSWLKLQSGVEKMHGCSLKMQRSVVALEKISDILNTETAYEETIHRYGKAGVQHDEEVVDDALQESTKDASTLLTLDDLDYIRIEEMSFNYERSHADGHQPLTTADDGDLVRVHDPDVHDHNTDHGRPRPRPGPFVHNHMCFDKASATIPTAGSMVYLVNEPDDRPVAQSKQYSKRTLLRLMAGLLHPRHGSITLPPHKRVVLVSRTPILVDGSILDNLRYGILPERAASISDEVCWGVAKTASGNFLCLITPLCSYLYGVLYGGLYERSHIIRYFLTRSVGASPKPSGCRPTSSAPWPPWALGSRSCRRATPSPSASRGCSSPSRAWCWSTTSATASATSSRTTSCGPSLSATSGAGLGITR
jgi:ABC-type multidrug transport system fused ATPase/permease subunit